MIIKITLCGVLCTGNANGLKQHLKFIHYEQYFKVTKKVNRKHAVSIISVEMLK